MPKKLTIEDVKNRLEDKGFTLLSDQYINSHDKLSVRCNNNHIFSSNINDISNGHGCPVCYGNNKLTIDVINENIKSRGYTLISTYKNRYDKLEMICEKGHHCSISYKDFMKPSGCKICKSLTLREKFSTPLIEIENIVKQRSFKLIDVEHSNNKTYLQLQCENGHIRRISLDSFKKGTGCKICSDAKKKIPIEEVKQKITNRGYELISTEYISSSTPLSIKCKCGYIFKKSFFDFMHQYQPCPRHRKDRSKGEEEVVNFIKTIYNGQIIINDRSMIVNPLTNHFLELDIWMPDIRKAIEYGSYYYHKEEDVLFRDSIKQQFCNENNINLLTIDDTDWKKNRPISINKIKHFMGITNDQT